MRSPIKWCDNFPQGPRPAKHYFLKADIEEFKKDAKTLDDQVREGNIDFAHKVFERFLHAPGRAVQDPDQELLKQKHSTSPSTNI